MPRLNGRNKAIRTVFHCSPSRLFPRRYEGTKTLAFRFFVPWNYLVTYDPISVKTYKLKWTRTALVTRSIDGAILRSNFLLYNADREPMGQSPLELWPEFRSENMTVPFSRVEGPIHPRKRRYLIRSRLDGSRLIISPKIVPLWFVPLFENIPGLTTSLYEKFPSNYFPQSASRTNFNMIAFMF